MRTESIDIEILIIAKTDKKKAFEIAFASYWECLFQHAYRKVQSEELAKDLTQETFIAFWNNLDMLAGQQKVLPYLYGVIRNKTLKLFETNSVRMRYAMNLAKSEPAADHSHSLLLSKELQGIITAEIDKMPPRMREIYQLKKDDCISIRDIAEKLSLSEQTVKNQLQNAYYRLRLRLHDYEPYLVVIILLIGI
jgi:RNA polymerase sigma-70 factor, ECF subfamily